MIRPYFIALTASLLVSLVVTPLSVLLAVRFNAIDAPGERKVHAFPRARWGGIGIMAGFLAGLAALWLLLPSFSDLLRFSQAITHQGKVLFTLNLSEQLAGILAGVVLLFGLGLCDDRKPVAPGVKFLVQVIAAYIAMTYGVRIHGLSVPGFEAYAHFPLWLVQVSTVLWLVGMTNAMNLIDGLDGMAAGVTAIVSGAFLAVTLLQQTGHSPLFDQQMRLAGTVAAALLGAVLGFLVYNFYPAQLFMGDSGSLSIGFILGCVAVTGAFKTTTLAVLMAPFAFVAVPVADMAIAFVRRLAHRGSPFAPDRRHLHHRLMDAGWTQREVTLLVYVITLTMSLVALTVVGVKRG